MVFYRKYRPQTLDELVGQTNVKATLKSAASSGKLSHAYLFTGPRGTGKTSTARILAKIVNCEKFETEKDKAPCNQCAICTTITDGSNLDVIEMDAASNRGIDDIRALRENIKLSPTSARKKIYIIDEVHMLSGDAFNALLKTLEEPPSHVMFILATTEIQKVPQTILSRVQRLDFKLATTEELIEALNKIAVSEKIDIDQSGLVTLAKKANGSFRDGVKLLDQLASLGVKIDQKSVEGSLGSGAFETQTQLLTAIAEGKADESLKKLIEQTESGVNIKELTFSLLDVLRQLLLIKNNLGVQLVKTEAGEDYQLLENLSSKFSLEQLIFTIDSIQKSLEQSRFVSIPSLPLELAVVESSLGSGYQKIRKPEDQRVSPDLIGVSGSESQRIGEPDSDTPTIRLTDIPVDRSTDTSDVSTSSDIAKITDRWSYVLETIRQYNYSLEALLRSARIANCEGNNVFVEVPYSFHQRMLEAPKSRDLLESILSDILGRSIKISTVLGKRPTKAEDIANVEIAPDDDVIRMAAEIFGSN